MTLTPCKERTARHDALPCQNALVFYAKIPPLRAGASVECMALVVVTNPGQRIPNGGIEGEVANWPRCAVW